MMKIKQDKAGFTLLELMVVIAIFCIIVMIGTPNYLAYREKSHVSDAARGIYSICQYAKMQALKRSDFEFIKIEPTFIESFHYDNSNLVSNRYYYNNITRDIPAAFSGGAHSEGNSFNFAFGEKGWIFTGDDEDKLGRVTATNTITVENSSKSIGVKILLSGLILLENS